MYPILCIIVDTKYMLYKHMTINDNIDKSQWLTHLLYYLL